MIRVDTYLLLNEWIRGVKLFNIKPGFEHGYPDHFWTGEFIPGMVCSYYFATVWATGKMPSLIIESTIMAPPLRLA